MSEIKIKRVDIESLKANIASWIDEYEACEFDKGYNSGICDALAEIDDFFEGSNHIQQNKNGGTMGKKLKIKRVSSDVKPPIYGSAGAGCFDVHAYTFAGEKEFSLSISDNESYQFGTGLHIEVPKNKALLVFSRSGQGIKYDVTLSNSTGVIDSDYTGELIVSLSRSTNSNRKNENMHYIVKNGDRIAQCLLVDAEQLEFEFVDEIKSTERGSNGFGSTGD